MLWRLFAGLLLCALTIGALQAQVHVKGYTRKDGTYVAPHVRSSPNSTPLDNWSVKGNFNPYTGEEGKKNPPFPYRYVPPPPAINYSRGPSIAPTSPTASDAQFRALFESWKRFDDKAESSVIIPTKEPVSIPIISGTGFGALAKDGK